MMGKLQLLGGVLFASVMMLAGCVAQTADEDEFDEGSAALVEETIVVGGEGTPSGTPRVPAAGEAVTNLLDTVNGGDGSSDPQPNPWIPTANAPIGPNDPGPTPMHQKNR